MSDQRASDAQLRIADTINAFAGTMQFVYIHTLVFAVRMLVFEENPWPTLTLAVSLEAIFLSTFVMIGQNRQAAFQQAKADHDYQDVDTLLVEKTELTPYDPRADRGAAPPPRRRRDVTHSEHSALDEEQPHRHRVELLRSRTEELGDECATAWGRAP